VPKITRIKQQKDKNRVNIYLDDKFGFGIDLENFVRLNLKVEQELTEIEVEEITKTAEFQKTSNKLLNYATLRPRSEKEIKDWLRRKKVDEVHHEKLFKKLNKLDLLDDKKFAVWWVDQRNSFRPRSKRVLIQELRLKGIDKNIIDNVLADTEIDELKIAKNLIKKNKYKWERFEVDVRKKKMGEYLMRKGFNWEIVKKALG